MLSDDRFHGVMTHISQVSLMATTLLEHAIKTQREVMQIRLEALQQRLAEAEAANRTWQAVDVKDRLRSLRQPAPEPQPVPAWDWHTPKEFPEYPVDLSALAASVAPPVPNETPPSQPSPVAQDEGSMVQGHDGSDACAVEDQGDMTTAQSEQFVEVAGEEGGEEHGAPHTASEPTSPAPDDGSPEARVLDLYAAGDVSYLDIARTIGGGMSKDRVRHILVKHRTDPRALKGRQLRGQAAIRLIRDDVLDQFATTVKSHSAIAEHIGTSPSSVSAFIAAARKDGDPRVRIGEERREEDAKRRAEEKRLREELERRAPPKEPTPLPEIRVNTADRTVEVGEAMATLLTESQARLVEALRDGSWRTFEQIRHQAGFSFVSGVKASIPVICARILPLGLRVAIDPHAPRARLEVA